MSPGGLADGQSERMAKIDGREPEPSVRRQAGAARRSRLDVPERQITALIGPSGCGKSTFLRCLNRMNDTIRGTRVTEAACCWTARTSMRPARTWWTLRRRVGMVFQRPNPFPQSRLSTMWPLGRACWAWQRGGKLAERRGGEPARRGSVGRGEGQLAPGCPGPVAGPAAAAVHRARHRRQARGDPDGRALLGARPDRHAARRGPDAARCASATPSSSSPTTCSRPRASRTTPGFFWIATTGRPGSW